MEKCGLKEHQNGNPALFYFVQDDIYHCPVQSQNSYMGSDRRYLIAFGGGMYIVNDRRLKDHAYCSSDVYAHPKQLGGV